MRELVLKLPKGKPPFIGIAFFQMGATPPAENTDLILEERYRGAKWELYIEFVNYSMNLKLVCLEKLIIRDYKGVVLDLGEFRKWLPEARLCTAVNFGHVTKHNHQHTVVKTPTGKPVVFKIYDVKLLTGVPA